MAYEMRISDGSSDVCSSDLGRNHAGATPIATGTSASKKAATIPPHRHRASNSPSNTATPSSGRRDASGSSVGTHPPSSDSHAAPIPSPASREPTLRTGFTRARATDWAAHGPQAQAMRTQEQASDLQE